MVEAHRDEDFPPLTSRADAALFRAKRDGRNRVVVEDDIGNEVPAGAGIAELVTPGERRLLRNTTIA